MTWLSFRGFGEAASGGAMGTAGGSMTGVAHQAALRALTTGKSISVLATSLM
jgi:hypothetical protein